MKENKFQKRVKKQLENQGAFVINLHGHMMQRAGLPDLFVLHRKWDGFLELKVEQNKTSVIQRIVAAKIELRGMPIYVLRCVERDSWDFVPPINLKANKINTIKVPAYIYTLENFESKSISQFDDLRGLLDTLVKIKQDKMLEKFMEQGKL